MGKIAPLLRSINPARKKPTTSQEHWTFHEHCSSRRVKSLTPLVTLCRDLSLFTSLYMCSDLVRAIHQQVIIVHTCSANA
ncbi:hypothetical protein AHF37_00138 [Paragonimus kellicotti]|nr:hypothetical protein AHF37_00138 [Paragonimus kellicotti]